MTTYETWQEPSGAVSIRLSESKTAVTNQALCLTFANALGNSVAGIEARADCQPSIKGNPVYNLWYTFESSHSQAVAILK